MVRDTREYDLRLRHRINNTQDDPVCRVKYGRIKECDLYNNRTEVNIINGTVIIKRVIRADSGNYRLRLVDSDGTETSRDLQVIVEAPIGSVEVSIICSSSGVMRVFCSSEGDQLLYSWTLNGDPLMDGNSSIDLDEGTDGDISCSMKNHVSHTQKTIRLVCPTGPTTAAVTSSLTSTSTQTSEYDTSFSSAGMNVTYTSAFSSRMCLEVQCSFNQSEPCYAALEHKLNLLMERDTREYELKIIKRINNTHDDPICRVKNGRIRECDLYNNRPEVNVINGTVIIKRVIRADSGNYRLTLTDSDGTDTSRDLQVIVEAPVGSVEVSIICSSSGVMRVFCSSEGDQLLYSWTLNGDPLMDGNSSIDLDEGTDGDISCSVKNHVSHTQKNIRLLCPTGPTTAAVTSSLTSTSTQTSEYDTSFSSAVLEFSLIALGCVALILILLFITICYVYKKKQLKSTQAAAGDTELIYADISHEKKSEKKNTEYFPDADVEYSAVQLQTEKGRGEGRGGKGGEGGGGREGEGGGR
ncbi:uncharacterized protein LOC109107132 [Cyprinus carpio]|uniref:Uncharacterized protein LOC109107132 n=1 Tax=Cyprinus carpio TaxID=7962 RepID=A0A9R0BAF2_CYPCA|nr:uncharacterized protein LOC109107132 [Cyprinus carpio]